MKATQIFRQWVSKATAPEGEAYSKKILHHANDLLAQKYR